MSINSYVTNPLLMVILLIFLSISWDFFALDGQLKKTEVISVYDEAQKYHM